MTFCTRSTLPLSKSAKSKDISAINHQFDNFYVLLFCSGPVCYIQRQNSNLTDDFPELMKDLDPKILDFGRRAFNKEPDAINFWMGDSRAITSMHKDPYENIYSVVSGYKDFILIPPVDVHLVPRRIYQSAIFESDDYGAFHIKPLLNGSYSCEHEIHIMHKSAAAICQNFQSIVVPQFIIAVFCLSLPLRRSECDKPITIEWVSIDPLCPDFAKYPNYQQANIYKVRINAGDMLYLPSLWYHHVQQSHKCIAVNYWFDMEYDTRYCHYKMIERLCGFKADE